MRKTVLKIILGTIILEAILICFFILLGDFNDVSWKSLLSVAIVLECSIPCLFYAKIYDNPKYKSIAILGITISSINAVISILTMWTSFENNTIGKFTGTLQNLMWLLVFISELLSYNSKEKVVNCLKKISIYIGLILEIFILTIIWTEKFPEGFVARLFYMMIVLTVASYLATLIAVKIYKKNINENLNSENGNFQDKSQKLNNDNNVNN